MRAVCCRKRICKSDWNVEEPRPMAWPSAWHALFTRMDKRNKCIVNSAIDNGSLRLCTHQDGSSFTDQEHISCVENILNLVAKETTTDRVKRLIRMTREVHDCKRGARESFADYAVRFESISRAYLSIAKASPNWPFKMPNEKAQRLLARTLDQLLVRAGVKPLFVGYGYPDC